MYGINVKFGFKKESPCEIRKGIFVEEEDKCAIMNENEFREKNMSKNERFEKVYFI